MGRAQTLDAEQVQVLRWVADGCPPGRYTDGQSHKLRARALAARGLVTVRRSQGVWTAGITDSGREFLTTGQLPTRARRKPDRRTATVPGSTTPSRPPNTVVLVKPAATRNQSPTAELVADVVAAEGDLTIDAGSRWINTNLTSLITASRRHSKTPPGTRLYMYHDVDGTHLRLLHVPGWTPRHDEPLPVPATTRRLHPALRAFTRMPDARRDLTSEVASRAARLLQALADEADRRGHHVSGPQTVHVDGRTPRVPALTFTMHDQQVQVRITQVHTRHPHQPTTSELDRQARLEWATPPKWDTVVTDRLRLHITSAHPYPDTRLTDGTTGLEEHLHQAMFDIEIRAQTCALHTQVAARRAAHVEACRLAEAQRQAQAALHAHRAATLNAQVCAWRNHQDAVAYADALRTHLATIDPDSRDTDAHAWLNWIDEHLAAGPFTEPLHLPSEP